MAIQFPLPNWILNKINQYGLSHRPRAINYSSSEITSFTRKGILGITVKRTLEIQVANAV
jgi:hypothetical protein